MSDYRVDVMLLECCLETGHFIIGDRPCPPLVLILGKYLQRFRIDGFRAFERLVESANNRHVGA